MPSTRDPPLRTETGHEPCSRRISLGAGFAALRPGLVRFDVFLAAACSSIGCTTSVIGSNQSVDLLPCLAVPVLDIDRVMAGMVLAGDLHRRA